MHYAPTQSELTALEEATSAERLDYFLTRAMEAEEVWGLSNGRGWAMKDQDGDLVLPIWPYSQFANANAVGEDESKISDAVSLEHFTYNLLPQLIEKDIHIEIMPTTAKKGLVLEAQALFEIIERKLDTSEYFIEG